MKTSVIKSVINNDGTTFTIGDKIYWKDCEDTAIITEIIHHTDGKYYLKFNNDEFGYHEINVEDIYKMN